MRYVLTNEQMREADAYTIKTLSVPAETLMFRAGKALAECAKSIYKGGKILVVCGGGNNGGDGFVCARILLEENFFVETVCFAERLSKDCEREKYAFLGVGGKVVGALPTEGVALVIDCLFGTGLTRHVEGCYAQAIEQIDGLRKSGAMVLSADIPSGIDDEGRALNVAVNADYTLCIGEIKTGVLQGEGLNRAGKILCADIGITLPALKGKGEYAYPIFMEKEIARKMLPSRKRNSHKGTYGKAAIVAGGEKYTGAAYLSTAACLRSGAGYTALFTPKGVLSYYVLKAPEALLIPSNDGGMFEFNKETFDSLLSYDAIAYGMGMGALEEVFKGAEYLLKEYKGKLILDADALNALALHREAIDELFANKKCDVVLTPHLGEFSRLTGKSVEDISKDGIFVAQSFAKKLGASILLKNAVSVITDGDRVAMNATGNSGQAKGGSGDVLSGVIAGLCASGAGVFDGAACGAYLVGNAAEIAAREIGEYSLLATDVIARLGKAFLGITENADKRGNEQ